eukprot:TRINITY_DN70714_c0_g1_i1.p1 TRINITY_DN70714_c0_g1~~TRINITY_DN70714_c0_g1_i1.p1  ORF type:complete len:397 (-),score=56.49 TRINITY_DN70714_c0_g1_i1:1681-2871(-)
MVVTAGGSSSSNTLDASTLKNLKSSQDELDRLADSLQSSMKELHSLQDSFETAVKKQQKALKAASQICSSTSSRRRRRGRNANEVADNQNPPNQQESSESQATSTEGTVTLEHFAEELRSVSNRLRTSQQLMPATGGFFVECFLGSINVRFARKKERLSFKKEYEKLKLKLAPVFLIVTIICFFFEDYRWVHMMLQLALSFYYTALAIRENILRVNGSNLRAWWIIHHYFTMFQGVLLLTWPNGESYAQYRRMLHLYGMYNAILMIFQYRYQMARLYALRSLGMANEMDVASSDSTQIHWSETMTLLLPLIVIGHFMQAFQASYLFSLYRTFSNELQIMLLSVLFMANFIGNSITTAQVLFAKRAERMRKSLTQVPSSAPAEASSSTAASKGEKAS